MAATNLVEQSEALVDFLDELLSEETDDISPAEQENEIEQAEQFNEIEVEAVEPIHEPELIEEDESGRQLVIPAWGKQPFQAMVFKVRDLSLAIPLQELVGVVEWQPDQVEQQAGTMLLLGHYQHAGQTVKVVDTARFIFPEDSLSGLTGQDKLARISRIILIDNGKIGLACDEVFEVVTLQPAQVTWRSAKTRRKWLAGTMLAEMTVVLDAAVTASLLSESLGQEQ